MKNPDEKWFKLLREEAAGLNEADMETKDLENEKEEGLETKLQILYNTLDGAKNDFAALSVEPELKSPDYETFKKVLDVLIKGIKPLETLGIKPKE